MLHPFLDPPPPEEPPVAQDVHCTWGLQGLKAILPHSDVVVIVDVLSFSTTVDVALAAGAIVYPWRWKDESGAVFADRVGAVLAGPRNAPGFSLSPLSLLDAPKGTKLVLPSPNGATLSRATGDVPTFAACLRNATACARAVQQAGRRIGVIAAGEVWPDLSLRPALEDWLGAGAVIAALTGTRSPEAQAAAESFEAARMALRERLLGCASGRELVDGGFERDVALAAELEASETAPRLVDDAYGA